ncbi:MAG: hypothetical protein R3B46_04405 [Phycisphaerales bacterium]
MWATQGRLFRHSALPGSDVKAAMPVKGVVVRAQFLTRRADGSYVVRPHRGGADQS